MFICLDERLWTDLVALNKQSKERLRRTVVQRKEAKSATWNLKIANPMAWGEAVNSIRNGAVESVFRERIYGGQYRAARVRGLFL